MSCQITNNDLLSPELTGALGSCRSVRFSVAQVAGGMFVVAVDSLKWANSKFRIEFLCQTRSLYSLAFRRLDNGDTRIELTEGVLSSKEGDYHRLNAWKWRSQRHLNSVIHRLAVETWTWWWPDHRNASTWAST